MLEPTGHHVLVEVDSVEECTESGIILAKETLQADKAATSTGTLYKVGMNAWKAFDDGHPWAEEGNRVVFAKYAGSTVTDPDTGIEYRLLNDADIICKIK